MFLPQVAMAPTGTEVGNGDAIDVREPAQFGVELYLCAGVHDVEFAAREIVHDGSVAELVDDLHRVDFPPGRLDPVRLRLEAELPGLFVDRQFIFGKLQQLELVDEARREDALQDRKSTRLNSSH